MNNYQALAQWETNRRRRPVPTMTHTHTWTALRAGHGTETIECDTCGLRVTKEV